MLKPHVLSFYQTRKCSPQSEPNNSMLSDKTKVKKQISSMYSRILACEYSTGCPLQKFESGLIRQEIKARHELEECATKSGHVTQLVRTFEKHRRASRAIKHKSNITARVVLERFTLEALNNELHRRLVQLEQDTVEQDLSFLRPLKKQDKLKGRKLKPDDCYPDIKVLKNDKFYISSDKNERYKVLWNKDNPASKRWQVSSHMDRNEPQLEKVGLESIYEEGSCVISSNAADKDKYTIYNPSHQKTDERNNSTSPNARTVHFVSNGGKINKDKNNNITTRSYRGANLEPDISLSSSSLTRISNDDKTILEEEKFSCLVSDLQRIKIWIRNSEKDFNDLVARLKIIREELLSFKKLRKQLPHT